MRCILLIVVISCLWVLSTQSQTLDSVTIGKISVEGNDQTRLFVIHRETNIKVGDRIAFSDLQHRLIQNEKLLLNTRLFVAVKISTVDWLKSDPVVNLLIEVKESWYFFPVPVFRLADRNFNVWWEEFDRDFNRVIWGVRGHHYNLSGVRDYLKVVTQFGFSQRFQIRYRYPYLNKQGTLGLELDANYFRAGNGAYNTINDRLVFLDDQENGNFKSIQSKIALTYRPAHILSHTLEFGYVSSSISDTVRLLNPNYYLGGASTQRFFRLNYNFKYDRRDRQTQAKTGYFIEGNIQQTGLGIYQDVNYGYVQLNVKKHFSLHDKITLRTSATTRLFFNKNKIPYNHSQGLGYGRNYIRGYEHYVIDGNNFFYSHQSILLEVLNVNINFHKILKIKKTEVIPLRFYFSTGLDLGYVNTPQYPESNDLDRRWVYGFGPSLEILVAENYLIGVNYSVNHFGDSGVFLHSKFNF